jgi:hypothetical protein
MANLTEGSIALTEGSIALTEGSIALTEGSIALTDYLNTFRKMVVKSYDDPDLIEQMILDSDVIGYFEDWGGRPASNHYKSAYYPLCICKSKFVKVHRALSVRRCGCPDGKRFIANEALLEAGLPLINIGKPGFPLDIMDYCRWVPNPNAENDDSDSDDSDTDNE